MDYEALFEKARPAFITIAMDLPAFDALVDELDEVADEHDVDVFRIRGSKSRTRQGFFDEIGAVLTLPHYFGENWDALNDVMYGASWMPGTLFVVSEAQQLFIDAEESDLANLVELFDAANRFYLEPPYDQGSVTYTGFHALLQTSEDERASLEQRLEAARAEFSAL